MPFGFVTALTAQYFRPHLSLLRLDRLSLWALIGAMMLGVVPTWEKAVAQTVADRNMSIVWQAVRNTRLRNNFHLSAQITGDRSESFVEADLCGTDFQLNTRSEILRFVAGNYFTTRDAGQSWHKSKPQTELITAILSPIASPHADLPTFDYLGTSTVDGDLLYHYRLHVPPDDPTRKDQLPQFWIFQDASKRWYVRRTRCPVMMPDETIPMVSLVITRIGEIKPMETPKVSE